MVEKSELSISYTREGEVVLNFPDGMRVMTGLFPNEHERVATKNFFDTTVGRSIIMLLRTREIYDDLTKLLLKAPETSIIEQNIARLSAMKFDGVVSVLMLDLDNFGLVNKEYGQNAGDQILEWFANILRRTTRTGDILSRWGGEEFIVFAAANKPADEKAMRARDRPWAKSDRISTGTTMSFDDQLLGNGRMIGRRIRSATETSLCPAGNTTIVQTVTVGVANAYITPESDLHGLFDELFELASEAMYKGKRDGRRNHVHVAPMVYGKPKPL